MVSVLSIELILSKNSILILSSFESIKIYTLKNSFFIESLGLNNFLLFFIFNKSIGSFDLKSLNLLQDLSILAAMSLVPKAFSR